MTTADSVETLRLDLRTRVKRLGAKEKARRAKYTVRVSLILKNKSPFPIKLDWRPTKNKCSDGSKAKSSKCAQTRKGAGQIRWIPPDHERNV